MRTWIPRPPVVLVVDDADDIVTLLAMFFAAESCVVRTALTPRDALSQIDGADVVVVDQRLPETSGTELIEKARAGDARCRFIVISGHEEARLAAERAGADAFLPKPLDIRELLNLVGRLYALGPAEHPSDREMLPGSQRGRDGAASKS